MEERRRLKQEFLSFRVHILTIKYHACQKPPEEGHKCGNCNNSCVLGNKMLAVF